MAISFPSSPSEGDVFTSNGKRWSYVNGKWESYGETVAPDVFYVDGANDRVGVGTTTPSTTLHVDGSILANDSVTIGDGGEYVAGSIYSDANWGMIFRAKQASPAQADFRWANSADTERMRIDASGNVGINDSTPSYTLDVNGDINTIGDLRIGGTAIGEWTSYTPTFGNVTGSVVSAKYALVNNVCHVSTTIQITAISNYFYLTLPFDCVNSYDLYSGNVFFYDVGSNIYFGHTLYFGPKDVRFSPLYSAGSYASYSTANASIPFTWASGDYLSFYLTYEVA